jgi:hypothetical protein
MSVVSLSQSKVYQLINKVLNILVRREFGKHYTVRLNSLCFLSNRSNATNPPTCSEIVLIKSKKQIDFNELLLIQKFITFNINSAQLCIDSNWFIEVDYIKLVII